MERSLIFTTLLLLAPMGSALAQGNDFGSWYELGAERKLSGRWALSAETELRTRNDCKTTDRWSIGVAADYKIVKGLKASAGYTLLYDNNPEELTFKSDGTTPKKWTPGYWGLRHRFNIGLSGSLNWNRFKFSLRERWQYTYRPETADRKYKFNYDDDGLLTGQTLQPVKGKGKHILRSRASAGYDIPHWKLDPTASIEIFNDGSGITKVRYQLGVDYKILKKHCFSLTYRYQDVNNDDDDNDANSHMVGLSYKYKF